MIENTENQPPPNTTKRKVYSFIIFLTLFLATILNVLFSKKLAIIAHNYPFSIACLTGIAGFIGYPLILLVLYFKGSFNIRSQTGDYKLWLWGCLIGGLFSLSNVLTDLGNRGNVVPGGLVLLISKLIVPCSMVFEYLPCFKDVKKFDRFNFLGIFILLIGIGISVGGQFTGGSYNAEFALYIFLLLGSIVPLALGGVIVQEVVQKKYPSVNIVYLWWIVSTGELPLLVILSFLNMYIQNLSLHQIVPNLWLGWKCILSGTGNPAEISPNVTSSPNLVGLPLTCTDAPLYYFLGLLFGYTYNLCIPWIMRYHRATIVWLLRAAALPFTGILFSLHFVMGEYTTPWDVYLICGLIVVFISLIVYPGNEIKELLHQYYPSYFEVEDEEHLLVTKNKNC